ncbi:RICIN domain-containing protein [Streptomyces sp. NPDC017943]|uniref:RICIN domain-containing protein n=1 Tax=Streptomyces sp. NPDC017943 TaxID=3365019 RepID=UPI00378AE932
MAAAAAIRRELARPDGGALRPRLLAAVRDTVGEWAADDAVSASLPELRKTVGARGLRAARSVTPERRRLAERAFRALPGASQCLLWHTEVEAESLSVPAGLLGVDAGTAAAALEHAREQFRTGCARAHRELAPTRECRYYNRLLDVPMRRGGALLPDVQRHLMACRYCRHAAEQLSHFEGGLGELLAETVLGWGARRYLESRPGRDPGHGGPAVGGRHRLTARTPDGDGRPGVPRRRHAKALAAAVGVTSLVLLATLLTARGWSEEAGTVASQATGGAARPDATAATVAHPAEVARGRLRNLDTDLCLDVRGGRLRADSRVTLAGCSAGSPQWTYRDDGLLRSAADPRLCLGSDAAEKSVVLAGCLVHAGTVRYDLTVRGELLPREGKGGALAPGSGREVTVAPRDGSASQRWALEPAPAAGGSPAGRGAEEPSGTSPRRAEEQPPGAAPPGSATRRPRPPRTGSVDPVPPERYSTRAVQVGCCAGGAPGVPSGDRAAHETTDALDAASTAVTGTLDTATTAAVTGALPAGLGGDRVARAVLPAGRAGGLLR